MELKELEQYLSPAYHALWNPELQAEIDRDIERHRKTDGVFHLEGVAPGEAVEVEQLTHSFIFGAHIFNFDQLGSDENNARYRELFGTLFNSATIAFYWKQFELEEGKLRFEAEARDSADFWNRCPNPKEQPHWRRPATDPVVEFCESKKIRLHGHPLTWGNMRWQIPEWLVAKLPEKYKELYPCDQVRDMWRYFNAFSPAEIEKMCPEFVRELNRQLVSRIENIAARYGSRIHSWDVVNESATDFQQENLIPGDAVCRSCYGVMPGDYPRASFRQAMQSFPAEVKLNINDYNLSSAYVGEVADLEASGCRIDIVGAQMHLFDPERCRAIAEGRCVEQSPRHVRDIMNRLSRCGKPIHLSEITITSPGADARGEAIQAVIARNLYRLWFSTEKMMGITWWNVVDDCGAPGEPSVSGLFHRDMTPKAAYHVLRELIQREWTTRTVVRADHYGNVNFRGFRGSYRLTAEKSGISRNIELH